MKASTVQAGSTDGERVRAEEVSSSLEGSIRTTRRAPMRTEVERSVQLSSTIAGKNKFALKMLKLAKTRVTVCAAKAYTDASTSTPLTTFTKSSIALTTLLCLYSRYVINCLRKVSETTSVPIIWIGSPPRGSARRPPPLVRALEVSTWSKARYACCVNQQKDTPNWWLPTRSGSKHVWSYSEKESERDTLSAVTFSLGQTKPTSKTLVHQSKVPRGSFQRKRPRYLTLASTLSGSSINLDDFSILLCVKLDWQFFCPVQGLSGRAEHTQNGHARIRKKQSLT